MSAVQLTVNGRSFTVDADPQTSLLTVLREQLDLSARSMGAEKGSAARARY